MPRYSPHDYIITDHTADMMLERGVSEAEVRRVLGEPGQTMPGHSGRIIHQQQFTSQQGKLYIVRVVVDESINPPEVITVYRTTQFRRYWRRG